MITPANRLSNKPQQQFEHSKSQSRNRSKSIKKSQRPRIASTTDEFLLGRFRQSETFVQGGNDFTLKPSSEQKKILSVWVASRDLTDVSGNRLLDNIDRPPLIKQSRRGTHKVSIGKYLAMNDSINLKRDVEKYFTNHRA
jgi:hypothetical protein